STNAGYADAPTNTRDPHRQICPWFSNADRTITGMASSRSVSSNTSVGFLPPSSRLIVLNSGAAVRAISAPVLVPPVNETVGTFGCATSAAPAFAPYPCTTLNTPAGRPASRHSSVSRWAVVGVNSDGLATTVLPVARAGATFQVNR